MRAKLELTTITLGVSKIHWQNLPVCMFKILRNYSKNLSKLLLYIGIFCLQCVTLLFMNACKQYGYTHMTFVQCHFLTQYIQYLSLVISLFPNEQKYWSSRDPKCIYGLFGGTSLKPRVCESKKGFR